MANTNKVDGVSQPAETLVGDLDFFTVTVGGSGPGTVRSDGSAGLDANGVPNDAEQFLFDKIIEAISQKAQPVLLTGGQTGTTVINVAVEHTTLWTEAGATDGKAETLDTVITDVKNEVRDHAGNQQFASTTIVVAFFETFK